MCWSCWARPSSTARRPALSRRGALTSRLDPAGLHLAAVHTARELGLAAGRQDTGLLDPVLALDAPLEIERLADALDVARRPVGDVVVGQDAQLVELLLDQYPDAADALEVLGGTYPQHAVLSCDALCVLGPGLGSLLTWRCAHGPERGEIGCRYSGCSSLGLLLAYGVGELGWTRAIA